MHTRPANSSRAACEANRRGHALKSEHLRRMQDQQAVAQRHVDADSHGHALSSAGRSASMQWLGQDAGQPPFTTMNSRSSSKTASMQTPEQSSAGPPLPKQHDGHDGQAGQHSGQDVQKGFERLMTVEEVQALGKELCSKVRCLLRKAE